MNKMLNRSRGGIEIAGHEGTWYIIDEGDFQITPDVDGKPETLTAHLFLAWKVSFTARMPQVSS